MLPIATVPIIPPALSASPICSISIVPVPDDELIATSPSAVVAPILPAKSTVPEPEVIVKVFDPSTVDVRLIGPLLESVSRVTLPARVTAL